MQTKGENLDYYMEFNIGNQIVGKLKKRADKTYPDISVCPTLEAEHHDYEYFGVKQRALAIKATVIEEYAHFKKNPLHTLLCISDQYRSFNKLE